MKVELLVPILLLWAAPLPALTPSEWRQTQTFEVTTPGLIRLSLPLATIDGARPDLGDLRVLDPDGAETAFLLERSATQGELEKRPQHFQSFLGAEETVVTLETGTKAPLVGVSLVSPGASYVKAVRVEGSHDGREWNPLIAGQAIFRMPDGAANARIMLPQGTWEYLRLTVDDRRSPAVPFTGATIHFPESAGPTEPVAISIEARDESPGMTRIALDLGAAHMSLSSLLVSTQEPLFMRRVSVLAPAVAAEGISEQPLAESTIYRMALDGAEAARLEAPVERQVPGRKLVLLIHNENSPPLTIDGVSGQRRPVRLLLFARQPGQFRLLFGNSSCPTAHYDLAGLRAQLAGAAAAQPAVSAPSNTPNYQPPDVLSEVASTGAPFDSGGWKYRKAVQLGSGSGQQVELDLAVLSRANSRLGDLRLVQDERQIPFLLEHTSVIREIAPRVESVSDLKKPSISRWKVLLPSSALPINRLACSAKTPLFERDMRLWEEVADDRGGTFSRELGSATWRRRPGDAPRIFAVGVNVPPLGDALWLETDNGDNAALVLDGFRCFYPVTRLVFKAPPEAGKRLWLYYGNRDAAAPRYDLGLVAEQLLRTERASGSLGSEENVSGTSTRVGASLTGAARTIFWIALVAVVAGLLFLVSRLLPKPV